jgi:hypothetical protein
MSSSPTNYYLIDVRLNEFSEAAVRHVLDLPNYVSDDQIKEYFQRLIANEVKKVERVYRKATVKYHISLDVNLTAEDRESLACFDAVCRDEGRNDSFDGNPVSEETIKGLMKYYFGIMLEAAKDEYACYLHNKRQLKEPQPKQLLFPWMYESCQDTDSFSSIKKKVSKKIKKKNSCDER